MYFCQKFEPKRGIMHGAGQSFHQFKKYWLIVGKYKPLLYMLYVRIDEIKRKIDKKFNEAKIFKNTIPQIGLNLKSKEKGSLLKDILSKRLDEELLYFCRLIKKFNKPVFLRVGYEFNNPTHNYVPEDFVAAWKYIFHFFKERKIKNVAFVWSCCTAFNRELDEIMRFYPGDDYVDWFSNNFFGVRHFANNKNKLTEKFAREAEKHKKPLMIAEASAARVGVEKGEQSWNEWFEPFFSWIESHEVVKAFCYINWNWGFEWKKPEWGNCRIEENPIVKKKYIERISKPIYLHNNLKTIKFIF